MIVVSRKDIVRLTEIGVLTSFLAACTRPGGNVSDGNNNVAQTSGTIAPSYRPISSIPVEPELASRNITPITPKGEEKAIAGVKLILPKGCKETPSTTSTGLPSTIVELPNADQGYPRLNVMKVDSFGRSLLNESYSQECLLSAERSNSYVARTREKWPGTDDAYMITWHMSIKVSESETQELDALGLWLGVSPNRDAEDRSDHGWVLYAAAPSGQLNENSDVWKSAFSIVLPS